MKQIMLFLLLIASGAALAGPETDARLNQLKTELGNVRQEQQSVYQNYQMTKDLRRTEVQEGNPPMAQHPYGVDINTPPPNYDDVLQAQQEREERIRQYTSELGELSARFIRLEKQKRLLLEQIQELQRQADSHTQ